MVTRGAKHLLVPSRSGAASSAASELVRELSDQKVVISTPKCDVSSKESLASMLEESSATLPPIKGCLVATMVLNVSNRTNLHLSHLAPAMKLIAYLSLGLHIRKHDPDAMGGDLTL